MLWALEATEKCHISFYFSLTQLTIPYLIFPRRKIRNFGVLIIIIAYIIFPTLRLCTWAAWEMEWRWHPALGTLSRSCTLPRSSILPSLTIVARIIMWVTLQMSRGDHLEHLPTHPVLASFSVFDVRYSTSSALCSPIYKTARLTECGSNLAWADGNLAELAM